ncbi:hypothetical protein SEPCBS119000_002964 [Sporothrix epigloea]|uniref:PPPDE domain-containing protein n=1 Tax=Sporothrix epigloea TaxID=1892477 RepID=A0ABP0DJ12_9PEZI
MAPKKHKKPSSRPSHRSTLSLQKTEVVINVYDLLTPGRWSTLLWHMGTSLLHSGVVIGGKEYAYGGHDRHGTTGVYWTTPRTEPPGGTFRCEILQGFALATSEEIDSIIRSASEEFHGPSYNLLTKNCNHFTAYLCRKLTGLPGPAWLNRAASIGMALPCIVPRDWVEPPEYDSAEGELLPPGGGESYSDSFSNYGDDDDYGYNETRDGNSERASMLRPPSQHRVHLVGLDSPQSSTRSSMSSSRASQEHSSRSNRPEPFDEDEGTGRRSGASGRKSQSITRDSAGHALPPSERISSL